jgi:hypothetical protein
MSKSEIGTWISGIGLVSGVIIAAAAGFVGDKTADLRLKVQHHDISIAKVESKCDEILRRLERMEGKLDRR